MRWKLNEFLYELSQDRSRKVLFVEGSRDLAFWRSLIPVPERKNTVIYPIACIENLETDGGERGRMIRVAEMLAEDWQTRIRFFADADMDRTLSNSVPPNVVLTDGRDLEIYGLSCECLRQICVSGFARDDETDLILSYTNQICRPLGILRITSKKNSMQLHFQKTMTDKNFRKLIRNVSGEFRLDMERLADILLQNSSLSLSEKPALLSNTSGVRH